ncbi:hypothetical protein KKA00_02330 [bacterium]|nr:hypothetical protein [bacterium]MBU1651031.1 hypothetical protein [bacterium]MBU1882399.1 hypothetical protein [bacterium]
MNKINPLQRPSPYQDDTSKDREKVSRSKSGGETFHLDHVEISSKARLVQKANEVQNSVAQQLSQDASRVGSQWYTQGYFLTED